MNEAIILAIISGAAIPALAWLFRDPFQSRIDRIQKLSDLKEKVKNDPALERMVLCETSYEIRRRMKRFKFVMFIGYVGSGLLVGLSVTSIGYTLVPHEKWDLLLAIGVSITLAGAALGIRDFARRGPRT